MKKKSDKEKDLEALKKDFEKAQNIFVTGFEKLTVQQDFELRKTVRRRQLQSHQEQPGGEGRGRHSGRRDHAQFGGHDIAGVYGQRRGGAGQGAHRLR
jgi:hypothetical protein